jgi:hypothetical protein
MAINSIGNFGGAGGGFGGGPTGPSSGGQGGGNSGGIGGSNPNIGGTGNRISAASNALNNSLSVSELSANDVSQDATPLIPAGAYDYGSGKVFTAFTVEDIVEGNTQRVTRGLWSGNSGELTSFWTSSYQSSTQKGYYHEIYNGDPTDSANESQFSIAYGNSNGSGSLGANEDAPSSAIYSQFQQVLLPASQTTFNFGGVTQEDIYVISINRARIKDKLDPGNWELCLKNGSDELRLIDDSGDVNQLGNSNKQSYNIVSGSLVGGIVDENEIYGAVYPQFGIIVLGAAGLDASASLATNRSTNVDAQNHGKLFTAISASATDNSANGFQARSEEEVKSTFFFVRAKNAEYNFSNNPSYVTGSNGKLKQQTFVGDPKTYITTVGLYNNDNDLLAIAKLSKPLLKSASNEILIKVKLDF